MREDAFRAWLAASSYTAKSQASRLSRCKKVEQVLHADLDALDLSDASLATHRDRFVAARLTVAMRNSLLNAARTYRAFRQGK